MAMNTASLEYRRAATQQASVVGLVIALHDTLMGDLRRAADAIDRGDIQTRCEQLVHGFTVLQQLEFMLDMEKGGPAAINIRRFYSHVRQQMLAAQFKLSSEMLRKQAQIVLEVREAWQVVDSSAAEGRSSKVSGNDAGRRQEPAVLAETRVSFSCSF